MLRRYCNRRIGCRSGGEERVLTPQLVSHGSSFSRRNHVSPVAAPSFSIAAYLPRGHTFGRNRGGGEELNDGWCEAVSSTKF
jgi:hypothetical protein